MFFDFFVSKWDHGFDLRSELVVEIAWLEVVLDLICILISFARTLLLELRLALLLLNIAILFLVSFCAFTDL